MLFKTLAYPLLVVGIVLMIFSSLNLYQTFSGQKTPPQLINQSSVTMDLSSLMGNSAILEGNTAVQTPQMEILSSATVNTSINLFIHFFAMSFFVGVGYKFASLGVQLLRPIDVRSSV